MIRIDARLICDGRPRGAACQEYFARGSYRAFTMAEMTRIREAAQKQGWTKVKLGLNRHWTDYCPSCSATRRSESRVGKINP